MNEIAATARRGRPAGPGLRAGRQGLGRRRRRRRPQRPDRRRLPGAGRAARCSCSSAASGSAAPRRSSARSRTQGFVISPCAYVVGLLDDVVIDELDLGRRGFKYWMADPNLWVPFEDGTSFGQFLDDAKTQQSLEALGLSKKDIDGYWAYEELFDDVRKLLRKGERDSWVGREPDARGDRGDARRRRGEDRPRLRGLDRRRPRPLHRRRAAQDGALRPGHHRHLGRTVRARHGLDQAHALPGRHRRPGPGLGLRRGRHGDDLLRDRRRRRARPARRSPAASRSRGSCPARASSSRTAPRSAPGR